MIHILGAGSLGLLWAARLARGAVPVTLVLRNHCAQKAWVQHGGQVTLEDSGRRWHLPIPAETPDSGGPIRHLILATKAYSAAEALGAVQQRLSSDCQVLMLQNGMGAQAQVSSAWPQLRVLYASVTDGAWMAGQGHVVWAGSGLSQVGCAGQGAAPEWLRWLDKAGIDWVWTERIEAILWQKLAINCAINPLSVLYDCRNGDVPAAAGARFDELVAELDGLLRCVGAGLEPGELAARLSRVVQGTAANSSSMRQDVQARRRTEIDFILGHAQRAARLHGLSTPVLDSLVADLQAHLARLGLPID
ncbi:2-dehydropantoate 2-reductase [Pseudomonas sp.]|uniref:2-dehydropantoate 2-reductase n=1 Tax=Pseudomonas sp. TaxID=306 RepID=UPI00272C0B4B|nr:2-dehydropantoate 2-reductase [Pseudomonas sp.]